MEFKRKINCPPSGTVCILDDSEIDLFVARRSFSKSKLSENFTWMEFQEFPAFFEYLLSFAGNERSKFPSLVFLDINMPGANGLDILKQIRSMPVFSDIPVFIMLTNSQNKDDIEKARLNGANGYKVKPFLPTDYVAFFDSFLQTG